MSSIWEMQNDEAKSFPKLDRDITTDILVIGGGIAGILCASRLTKQGFNVALVEKNTLGSGITKNTTATITAQQDKLYQDRIKDDGLETAKMYLEASLEAIKEYQELANEYEFAFKECSSIAYSLNDREQVIKEYNALHQLGYSVKYHDKIDLPLIVEGAIEFENQAVCDPIKLINQLAQELIVYEHTKVIKIKNNLAITVEGAIIRFQKAIIATHYPMSDLSGMYFVKMHQVRSRVAVINDYPELSSFYIDMNKGGLYFRSVGSTLLVGGNDYRVGECHSNSNFITEVMKVMKQPIADEFVNQDCITLDEMPYIGRLSHFNSSIYVATGFNEYGMTNAMLSAMIISDLIMKKTNPYAKLFSPQRTYKLKPLLKQLKVFVTSFFKFGGKRCKHLGCTLNFNQEERTYECLCHGSRYTSFGEVKNEPTKKNLSIRE